MDKLNILQKLKELVSPFARDKNALEAMNEETSFIQDLKINSANMVDIFIDMEEAFDIQIDNESLEGFSNVGDAIDIISKLIIKKEHLQI